jgi:hypothetical protein
VDHRFKLLIRVGALGIIGSFRLCRNDKVFNDIYCSLMQIIYRCSTLFHSWSSLQRMENRNLFTEVSTLSGTASREFITQYWWQHNLKIGLVPPSGML